MMPGVLKTLPCYRIRSAVPLVFPLRIGAVSNNQTARA